VSQVIHPPPRSVPRASRAAATALLVAGLVGVGLAGCGGGDSKKPKQAGAPTGSAAALALQQQFVNVVTKVSPQVVQIKTPTGLGSGVVIDGQGHVVTNAHVVGLSTQFVVTLSDGGRHPAKLAGTAPESDLAVVRLTDTTPGPATLADSSKVHTGDVVLAIGNPLGLRSSVTEGIVSSLGRSVPEGNGVTIPSAIQTSAAINPGNSGGALVDLSGAVVGIPTLAATDPEFGNTPAPGIGFAIPSNTVRRVADRLIRSGSTGGASPPYLGVEVATLMTGGVAVNAVVKGGPADKAGIRPGDVIVAVAGHPTPTAEDLASVVATLRPGQTVKIDLIRSGGGRLAVSLTVGKQPQ
jgi:S1-C subfamily serine protease